MYHKPNAQIAQLVEQRTENPRVAGSIPALGIFIVFFDHNFSSSLTSISIFCILSAKGPGIVDIPL